MLNNKKNIIIAGLLILILIIALILALTNRQPSKGNQNSSQGIDASLPAPQFMTAEEKTSFKLDGNVKAQVLMRDASGTPTIYRLINSNADIVTDPSKIGSISPRQSQR